MRWSPRAGARWLVRVGVALSSFLVLHPADGAAAGQPAKAPSAKRAPQEPAKRASQKPSAAKSRSMPAKKARMASASPTTPKPVPATKAAAQKARTPGDSNCLHIVRRGDSITRVAARYRVSRQGIASANDLGASSPLGVGRRLSIPGCGGANGRLHARESTAPPPAVQLEDGLLLARVGPARVPTRLFVAVPDFLGEGVEFAWPVDGSVASGFGRRRSGWHAGIDIKADPGTPVLAAAAGTVVFSGWAAAYGRLVKIQHSNGFVTIYAHNHENLVQVGDEVAAGALIATVGRSGRASAEHLHFEIRRDGMAFNPLHLLDSRDSAPVLASVMTEPLGDETTDDDVP